MRFKILTKNKISQLPKAPGVYAFKKGKEFFYIGKAANIQERVKNHLRESNYRDSSFINQTEKIGYIKTNSEIQALILEAKLIKKYQPKYNVIWRDDKNYFFVGIIKEDFPRVFITHQPLLESRIRNKELRIKKKKVKDSLFIIHNSKFRYVGPFVDGKALKQTLKILRKIFPYRSCSNIPNRPCLWYQLKRCPAPCLVVRDRVSNQLPNFYLQMKKECQANVQKLMKILQGDKKSALANLKKEMKKASQKQDFEKATLRRDQIRALEKVLAHSRVFQLSLEKIPNWKQVQKTLQTILKTKKEISRIEAYDISNIQGQEATGSMVTFINGLADKNLYRRFRIKIAGKPDDVAMLKEILKRRFKHQEWPYPDLILIDGGLAQLNAALKIKNQESRIKNKIKVTALAKRENKLYIENRKKPILLKSLPREVFNLILQMRDEAHHFAHQYHLKLRKKTLIP